MRGGGEEQPRGEKIPKNTRKQTSQDNYDDKASRLLQTIHLSLALLPIQY